jgi:hypothetical protein
VYRLAIVWRFTHAFRGNPPLTVTLPNKRRIEVPEAVVRWSRGQEFAVEKVLIEQHNHVRLQHYVNRLVREPERMSQLVLTAPNENRRPF